MKKYIPTFESFVSKLDTEINENKKVLQPNFEKIKNQIYELAKNDIKIAHSLLGGEFIYYPKKKTKLLQDIDKYLDTIDIRQADELIDTIKEKNGNLPKWMFDKKFTIDYNNNDVLDLIEIK